ncbi:MAG: hypothetical protein JNM36_02525 [Chitinophagales bacterium]|jgi:hypothetical protein|nr:hypothetical protein [Chitinophagales bacterium]
MRIFFFIVLLCHIEVVLAQNYLVSTGFESVQDGQVWSLGNGSAIDTTYRRNGMSALRVQESGSVVYQLPLNKVGKIEFSWLARGSGSWNVMVMSTSSTNFDDENVWKRIESVKIDVAQNMAIFETKTVSIHSLDRIFVRLLFEKIGDGVLYVDDINITPISSEMEAKIKSELAEEKNRIEREKHVKTLIETANYDDAKVLMDSYERLYQSRIKTLSMLYDKTNIVKVVSGTASALGNLNQLSNPTKYEEYQKITQSLLPKLQPIDTLFFGDQVRNKIDQFFQKIESPLNIITGIGDLVTGGGISRIVDNVKGLITKGFSTERLEGLGFRKEKLAEEQQQGIRLYNKARVFFDVIQEQNDKNMVLNKKIYEVYENSKALNHEILHLYIAYLNFAKIAADKNLIDDVTKNQDYQHFANDSNLYFSSMLGTKDKFDKYYLTGQIKELDAMFQQINYRIEDYDKLANQMSSFYSDFRNTVNQECPFKNVSSKDKMMWETEIKRIQMIIAEVEQTFNTAYTKVDFKGK